MPVRYPADANTDKEKLEYAYILQQRLRLQHNSNGADFKNGILTRIQWETYKAGYKRKSKLIGYQIAIMRSRLNYDTVPHDDEVKQEEMATEENRFRVSTRWNPDLGEV